MWLKNDLIFRQKEEAIDLMKCMVRWPPGIKIVIISKEREKKGKKESMSSKRGISTRCLSHLIYPAGNFSLD